MGEQRNLTEENVEVLTKELREMQKDNPELEYEFFKQQPQVTIEQLRKLGDETWKAWTQREVWLAKHKKLRDEFQLLLSLASPKVREQYYSLAYEKEASDAR